MPSLASSSTRRTYVHRHRRRQNTQIHKSKLNGVYMCLYPQIYAPLNSSHPVGRSYRLLPRQNTENKETVSAQGYMGHL